MISLLQVKNQWLKHFKCLEYSHPNAVPTLKHTEIPLEISNKSFHYIFGKMANASRFQIKHLFKKKRRHVS